MPIRLPLNGWTITGLVSTIIPLVIWEWVSLIALARLCAVPEMIAWIPAVATSGVMLSATALHMTPTLEQGIRSYAGWLAAVGITFGFLGTGTQHVLESAHIAPHPLVALPVGGVPVAMGGLTVHLLALVFGQVRREQMAADHAKQEAERRRLAEVEQENQRRLDEAAVSRRQTAELQHQRDLTAEAQRTVALNRQAADEVARKAQAADQLREATERRAEVAREVLAKPHLVVDNTRKPKAGQRSVSEQAIAWLLEQGEGFESIGPAEIARQTGLKPETCRQSHRRWKAEVAERRQVLAELEEAAG